MTKTIADIIVQRGIREVVHFTTNWGFLGSLARSEVLPRNRLREDDLLEHILLLNSPFRAEEDPSFDRSRDWINYVNLSISDITTNLFRHASMKWHANKDIFWVILAFDPVVMCHDGVMFSTTNNIYQLTKRAGGPDGLEALFVPTVGRRGSWFAHRRNRLPHLPTCEQAEVLYPDGLSMEHLKRVYVRQGDHGDRIYPMLREYRRDHVEIAIDPQKFLGAPN